jgi:hypothetical protein
MAIMTYDRHLNIHSMEFPLETQWREKQQQQLLLQEQVVPCTATANK